MMIRIVSKSECQTAYALPLLNTYVYEYFESLCIYDHYRLSLGVWWFRKSRWNGMCQFGNCLKELVIFANIGRFL